MGGSGRLRDEVGGGEGGPREAVREWGRVWGRVVGKGVGPGGGGGGGWAGGMGRGFGGRDDMVCVWCVCVMVKGLECVGFEWCRVQVVRVWKLAGGLV